MSEVQDRRLVAEVIAIGDELTSGYRLDTNSQWLSQRLGDLGVVVLYHACVGDDLDAIVGVFQTAVERSDVIVCTGGLGPTADDLTRDAIAAVAGVSLELRQDQLDHLESFFTRRGRTMTPSNVSQATFPSGCVVIPNPEGTAPGIELAIQPNPARQRRSTVFALPGVPAEMVQMFTATVGEKVRTLAGQKTVVHHHVIRCFGTGESHLESLLPDIVARGRDPQVGITASGGTISLRLTTAAASVAACLEKMRPTIAIIHESLGDLVYGENGDTLPSVVAGLLKRHDLTVAIADMGLFGHPAMKLLEAEAPVLESRAIAAGEEVPLVSVARQTLADSQASLAVAIGPVNRNADQIDAGRSEFEVVIAIEGADTVSRAFSFSGHSDIRQTVGYKRVLNFLRLTLIELKK